jgi:predicted  nucleic acid-binding Zn-ribbon protein
MTRLNADELKKLNDQMKAFDDLVRDLWAKGATTAEKAVQSWAATLKKIDDLTLLSEEKRNQARQLAFRRFLAEMVKAEYEAEAKRDRIAELAMQKAELDRGIQGLNSDISGFRNPFQTSVPPPNLADDAGYRALRDAELGRRKQWEEIQAAARQSRERAFGGRDAWIELPTNDGCDEE